MRAPTAPDADHRNGKADGAVVDMTEAWLLRDRVGETFDAIPLDTHGERAKIAIQEPPIRASAAGDGFVVGRTTTVRLTAADVATRTVQFEKAGR